MMELIENLLAVGLVAGIVGLACGVGSAIAIVLEQMLG